MSDAIFSAEYAAELVQRARDGATFRSECQPWRGENSLGFDHCLESMCGVADSEWDRLWAERTAVPHRFHYWVPVNPIAPNDYDGDFCPLKDHGAYWREWYRETEAAWCLMLAIADSPKGWDFDDGGPDGPIQQWSAAQPDDSEGYGTHGAIHALYVTLLHEMLSNFEGAMHALGRIQI